MMSSFFHRYTSNQSAQIGTAAVVGALVAGTAILSFQAAARQERVAALKRSIPTLEEEDANEESRHTDLTEYGFANTNSLRNDDAAKLEDEHAAIIAGKARKGDYADELITEQLTRSSSFLTPAGLEKVKNSFVIVIGLGGVGSHAVTALARSGVSHIRLIDFDQVTLSSLNRHALATLADVGTPKVHCVRKRLEQIVPWVHFDCRNELYSSEAAATLLHPWSLDTTSTSSTGDDFVGHKPDFVLDCIDNISSKVALLHYCHNHSIPVISSMGAGCKSDPTRISIGDISASIEDPLSRSTRRRLKLLGVQSGIPVVFSTEKPAPGKAALLPLDEEEFQKGTVGDLGVLPDFRVRILPVLGTMPAIFGYSLANYVICKISGYPIDFISGARGRERLYDQILAQLQGQEERLARWQEDQRANAEPSYSKRDIYGLRIPITKDDVSYLFEEVYRGRSVISGLSTRLALTRWKRSSSSSPIPDYGFGANPDWESQGQKSVDLKLKDLVLMTKEEASKHEKECLMGGRKVEDLYSKKVVELVERRVREEEFYEKYR